MSVNLRGTRREICGKCRGTGKVFRDSVWEWGWKPCPDCKGEGYIEYKIPPRERKF